MKFFYELEFRQLLLPWFVISNIYGAREWRTYIFALTWTEMQPGLILFVADVVSNVAEHAFYQ